MAEGDFISAGCLSTPARAEHSTWGVLDLVAVLWGDPRGDITMLAQGVRGTEEKPSKCSWPVPGRCGGSS